ncbi:hypothetical protein [Marinicella rhabdoformis]|uniref:hypothetical protein n=1 Tax=Marinicella rhabdoformis TaxID=2580566 RepID=UPI0012AEB2EF|nr:hypothetical protein [Marinicella rhabdoformis]
MKINILTILFIIMSPMLQAAKPAACTGVAKTCTENDRFDKTIDGQEYSCYSCKQVVCKSGGSGPIAGTETSSVCESKAPSGRALISTRQELQFDEADAIFGKKTEVKGAHPKPKTTSKHTTSTKRTANTQGNDHRYAQTSNKKSHRRSKGTETEQIIVPNNRTQVDHRKKSRIKKNTERGTKAPAITQIKAPSQVTLYDVTNNQLSIIWMDNANNEYGVSVERGRPQNDRGGINYNWQHVFNVEERIHSNVKGTGWRTDGDDGLSSNTKYCYRLRAYRKSFFSSYSKTVCTQTK